MHDRNHGACARREPVRTVVTGARTHTPSALQQPLTTRRRRALRLRRPSLATTTLCRVRPTVPRLRAGGRALAPAPWRARRRRACACSASAACCTRGCAWWPSGRSTAATPSCCCSGPPPRRRATPHTDAPARVRPATRPAHDRTAMRGRPGGAQQGLQCVLLAGRRRRHCRLDDAAVDVGIARGPGPLRLCLRRLRLPADGRLSLPLRPGPPDRFAGSRAAHASRAPRVSCSVGANRPVRRAAAAAAPLLLAPLLVRAADAAGPPHGQAGRARHRATPRNAAAESLRRRGRPRRTAPCRGQSTWC